MNRRLTSLQIIAETFRFKSLDDSKTILGIALVEAKSESVGMRQTRLIKTLLQITCMNDSKRIASPVGTYVITSSGYQKPWTSDTCTINKNIAERLTYLATHKMVDQSAVADFFWSFVELPNSAQILVDNRALNYLHDLSGNQLIYRPALGKQRSESVDAPQWYDSEESGCSTVGILTKNETPIYIQRAILKISWASVSHKRSTLF